MSRFALPFMFLVLVALGILIYMPALGGYFVSDDWHWLWSARMRARILPDFFANYAGERVGGSYNPVSSLVINALYGLVGLRHAAYHFVSILLHASNSALVACFAVSVARLLHRPRTSRHRGNEQTALWTAGILFLVWPTHVEAVAWMSGMPHLLAAFFMLISLCGYMYARISAQTWPFIASGVAVILAIFSKESALIVLPLLLIVEIAVVYAGKARPCTARMVFGLCLLLCAVFFLALRYNATSLLFGTYAEPNFVVRPLVWLHTAATFPVEMATAGWGRALWSQWYFSNPAAAVAGIIVAAATLISIILRRKMQDAGFLALLFMVAILPYVTLGFNRLSHDGERYTYLPAVFFICLVALLVARIRTSTLAYILMLCAALAGGGMVYHKSLNWRAAGDAARRIVTDASEIVLSSSRAELLIFAALPDTIGGAHVFRNNLAQAVSLTTGTADDRMVLAPVYARLNRHNAYADNLLWTADDRGGFIHAQPHMRMITGNARSVTPIMIYELWGYDYDTFTSDSVRLIFSDAFRDQMRDGRAALFAWNRGQLQALEWP